MIGRLEPMAFAQLVEGPPILEYISNEGKRVTEDQVLVGHVEAPKDKEQYLAAHGIDLRFATFDPGGRRWTRCLFSVQVLDLLEQLQAEGDFPYPFVAEVSDGEADWRTRKARGETERPPMPLRRYLVPASEHVKGTTSLTTED